MRNGLTAAEREVLGLRAGGHTNKEIAVRRGTSESTIKKQVHALYGKLGVESLAEALVEVGWLVVPGEGS